MADRLRRSDQAADAAAGATMADAPAALETALCLICADDSTHFAVGKCNHPVCGTCSLKMRQLYGDTRCPICKTDLQRVAIVGSTTASWEELDTGSMKLDKKWDTYFDSSGFFETASAWRSAKCGTCGANCGCEMLVVLVALVVLVVMVVLLLVVVVVLVLLLPLPLLSLLTPPAPSHPSDMRKLRGHLKSAHKQQLCELCVKHRKVFLFGQTRYGYKELKQVLTEPAVLCCSLSLSSEVVPAVNPQTRQPTAFERRAPAVPVLQEPLFRQRRHVPAHDARARTYTLHKDPCCEFLTSKSPLLILK